MGAAVTDACASAGCPNPALPFFPLCAECLVAHQQHIAAGDVERRRAMIRLVKDEPPGDRD